MKDFKKLYTMLKILGRGRHAFVMLIMMLVGMCFELLSIGLVIPIVNIMTKNNPHELYTFLEPLMEWLNYPDRYELITISMIFLIVIYGFKALFLSFLAWEQSKFSFNIQAIVSQRLFSGYLRQPWIYHIHRNSAQLIRNLTTESNLFSGSVVTPVLQLLTEIVVIIGISILLFLIEPLVTLLIIMGFSIFSWLAHVKFRNPITQWGRLRQMHEGMRIQYAQQGLGGVKELKILGREDGVSNQYLEHNFGSANVSTKKATVQLLPRLWLEFMAITSLGLVVLVMLSQERPMPSLIATIAMFGVAAFRLMPSVNRVLASMQSFRYGIPVIHNLYEEICAIDKSMPNNSINIKFQDTIEINKVFYRYPEAAKYALKDVNLVIPYGTSVGFIGDTGMGKSTLIDVILGLLNPDSGSILVDGVEIQTQLRGWQDKIGYVPQAIFLSDETLRKNIAFGLPDDEIDDNTIDEVLKATQLFNFVQQLPNGLDTFVGERGVRLSGGQRQRIGIARALYCRPSVLVLDEATNSLDGVTEARVMESVFALKDITLIIIAHRLSTVANCDKLYRLNFGEVVESDSIKGSY